MTVEFYYKFPYSRFKKNGRQKIITFCSKFGFNETINFVRNVIKRFLSSTLQ